MDGPGGRAASIKWRWSSKVGARSPFEIFVRDVELTANIHHEEGAYWADVPQLPGCFASGDTFDELFDSLKEGVQLYLENDDRGTDEAPFQIKGAILSDSASA